MWDFTFCATTDCATTRTMLYLWVALGSLSLVLLFCWCAVRRQARFITPEDTSIVCGISRLGLICKLANVCGHPVPLVEAARFCFFPATGPTGVDGARDPRTVGGITSLKRIRDEKSSATLVVAFSGGATNKIGLARLEFRRMLSQYRGLDQLYVLDPTGMSFYEHNLRTFREQLASCLSPYAKVIFLGNCMGATAALRFSSLLQHSEDTVLAFNPEVTPASDPRCAFRVAACLSPSKTSRLRTTLEKAVTFTPAKIRLHVSNWPPERSQAMLLLEQSEEAVVFDVVYQDYDAAAAARSAAAVVDSSSASSSLPRVVRILHRECDHHGLLAKRLKGNGALRKILDEAVVERSETRRRNGDGSVHEYVKSENETSKNTKIATS